MAYQPITDDEYQAALQNGAARLSQCLRASAVWYDAARDHVMIGFEGTTIGLDRRQITEFAEFTPKQFATLHLSALGDALALADASVQVDIAGLLKSISASA